LYNAWVDLNLNLDQVHKSISFLYTLRRKEEISHFNLSQRNVSITLSYILPEYISLLTYMYTYQMNNIDIMMIHPWFHRTHASRVWVLGVDMSYHMSFRQTRQKEINKFCLLRRNFRFLIFALLILFCTDQYVCMHWAIVEFPEMSFMFLFLLEMIFAWKLKRMSFHFHFYSFRIPFFPPAYLCIFLELPSFLLLTLVLLPSFTIAWQDEILINNAVWCFLYQIYSSQNIAALF
jgi:hypothetical protein